MDEARGSGVERHESRHDGFVPAAGLSSAAADAIERHVERYLGPVEYVLHEFVSHLVEAHVLVTGPTADRPYRSLVTAGMSGRPMTVPDGVNPFAEVMTTVPAAWSPSPEDWPVRVLKQVARLPHEYGTWVGEWHSLPNGEPYTPDTPFAGVVVAPMVTVAPEARVIHVGDGTAIDLLALVPLHPAEVALKVDRGTQALVEVLDEGGVTELLDPDRPSLLD
ncbi:suppressor of fused domain protein [Actinokineospora auranticolor]|uniref:Suppressor of fused protein SUFU n=1 Tax=Actinokineospora auranticolor TaxID=155976 RepID=A0A2S6H080_9PSEU|nr:suppressor of fused domain protein [Actinokineospora auranticolor]PPK70868.1 suppressor of fused protein SUFU [Actinokineospora auranticolor]